MDFQAVLLIPVLTGLLAAVCYAQARTVRKDDRLRQCRKTMIIYACLFCFGMGYAIVFKDALAVLLRFGKAWIAVTVLWAFLIAVGAWVTNRRPNES